MIIMLVDNTNQIKTPFFSVSFLFFVVMLRKTKQKINSLVLNAEYLNNDQGRRRSGVNKNFR